MNNLMLPKWNLNDLYSSIDDPKITTDLEKYKQLNLDLSNNYKGKIATISAEDFASSLKTYEKSVTLANFLGDFAYLNMVTQMKNTAAMSF